MKADVHFEAEKNTQPKINIDSFGRDSVLEFGYCTEFLLRLTTAKCDPDTFDADILINALTDMGGESIVAYREGDVVKVHVHTFTPGEVLNLAQKYGEFLTLKIENMSVAHSDEVKKPNKKREKLSVLAVASGEGISALFLDIGATGIVSGGQTANPSTEEFIEAFKKYDAENIIVLPNNKNVFLAANQAKEMYKDANVYIVPTRNLMQGYGALSVISPGITDMDMLVRNAQSAAEDVLDVEITRAVRHVTMSGKEIDEGDYISISGGEIAAVADSSYSCVLETLEGIDMDDYELITLFVGKDVSEDERVELQDAIEEKYPDHELTVYDGGQELYDYYIAIE